MANTIEQGKSELADIFNKLFGAGDAGVQPSNMPSKAASGNRNSSQAANVSAYIDENGLAQGGLEISASELDANGSRPLTAGGISAVTSDVNALGVMDNTNKGTQADEDGTINKANGRAGQTQQNWQNKDKLQINPMQNTNIAMQGRYGNLNGKTYANTLNLSRMADALNNKRHWIATDVGYRAGGELGTQAAGMGHSERWEPIDTQEMRQMRANERLDELQRTGDVNLQTNINGHTFDLQKQMDDITNRLIEATGNDNINYRRAVKDAILDIEYRNPATLSEAQRAQIFAQRLQKEIDAQVVQKAYNIWLKNPMFGSYWSDAMGKGQMPSYKDQMYQEIIRIAKQSGSTVQEQLQILSTLEAMLTMNAVYANGAAFTRGLSGGLFNTRRSYSGVF